MWTDLVGWLNYKVKRQSAAVATVGGEAGL